MNNLILIEYIKKRGVLIAILLFFPAILFLNHLELIHWIPICPFKDYLNIKCFGCGTNRAILELFSGNFYQSLNHNPFGFIYILVIPILTYFDIKTQAINKL